MHYPKFLRWLDKNVLDFVHCWYGHEAVLSNAIFCIMAAQKSISSLSRCTIVRHRKVSERHLTLFRAWQINRICTMRPVIFFYILYCTVSRYRTACLWIAIKMHICMSSQQKTLVYALWQEEAKLVYAFFGRVNQWFVKSNISLNQIGNMIEFIISIRAILFSLTGTVSSQY